MEKKTYKLWIARDEDGSLYAYEDKPILCHIEWIGLLFGSMKNSYFPNLTWKDEPIEIEVESRPTITDLDIKAHEYANSITDNEEIKKLIINAYKAGYNL